MRIGHLSGRFENSLLWHVKSRPNLQELLNEVEGPIYLLLTAQTRQTAFGPKVKRTVTASGFNREGRVCELSIAMPEIHSFDDKSINQFAAWANKQEDEAKPITTFVGTNRRPTRPELDLVFGRDCSPNRNHRENRDKDVLEDHGRRIIKL